MALNNWVSKWAAVAVRMSAHECATYPFKFVNQEWLEHTIVEEVCDECEGNCTGTSPLDVFCKHHVAVKKFIECAIAGDMAMKNWPLYKIFQEVKDNESA